MTFFHLLTASAIASLMAGTVMAQSAAETCAEHLTPEAAAAIALQAQPGTVAEAELDEFEGRAAFDIEIVNEAGDEVEFKIDAQTGEILNEWVDDDPSNDPVAGETSDADSY